MTGRRALPNRYRWRCALPGAAGLVARTVHPEYREVMHTYAQHQGLDAEMVGFGDDGRLDLAALERSVSEETPACWCSRRTSSA